MSDTEQAAFRERLRLARFGFYCVFAFCVAALLGAVVTGSGTFIVGLLVVGLVCCLLGVIEFERFARANRRKGSAT